MSDSSSKDTYRWYYSLACPGCRKTIEFMADEGVTRETPQGPITVRCLNCGRRVQLTDAHLQRPT